MSPFVKILNKMLVLSVWMFLSADSLNSVSFKYSFHHHCLNKTSYSANYNSFIVFRGLSRTLPIFTMEFFVTLVND